MAIKIIAQFANGQTTGNWLLCLHNNTFASLMHHARLMLGPLFYIYPVADFIRLGYEKVVFGVLKLAQTLFELTYVSFHDDNIMTAENISMLQYTDAAWRLKEQVLSVVYLLRNHGLLNVARNQGQDCFWPCILVNETFHSWIAEFKEGAAKLRKRIKLADEAKVFGFDFSGIIFAKPHDEDVIKVMDNLSKALSNLQPNQGARDPEGPNNALPTSRRTSVGSSQFCFWLSRNTPTGRHSRTSGMGGQPGERPTAEQISEHPTEIERP